MKYLLFCIFCLLFGACQVLSPEPQKPTWEQLTTSGNPEVNNDNTHLFLEKTGRKLYYLPTLNTEQPKINCGTKENTLNTMHKYTLAQKTWANISIQPLMPTTPENPNVPTKPLYKSVVQVGNNIYTLQARNTSCGLRYIFYSSEIKADESVNWSKESSVFNISSGTISNITYNVKDELLMFYDINSSQLRTFPRPNLDSYGGLNAQSVYTRTTPPKSTTSPYLLYIPSNHSVLLFGKEIGMWQFDLQAKEWKKQAFLFGKDDEFAKNEFAIDPENQTYLYDAKMNRVLIVNSQNERMYVFQYDLKTQFLTHFEQSRQFKRSAERTWAITFDGENNTIYGFSDQGLYRLKL